jgi:N-acetylglucosamine kinase-like BadF-type ATPase
MYYMGIDGGGTSLRIVIVDPELNIIAQQLSEGGNPSRIGRELVVARIQQAIADILLEYPVAVSACGVGIAGAAASHSADWLIETVKFSLPNSLIVPSSDLEIALVGAHGERSGLLLLAGTGSAAFGIDRAGHDAMVGGWGYLVDDLGSGYWIGNQSIQHVVQVFDGRRSADELSQRVLQHIDCTDRSTITRWLYQHEDNIVSRIASLTDVVLKAADGQNSSAISILETAASHLEAMVIALRQQLSQDDELPIRFGGGLLQDQNPLSMRVCERLNISPFPTAKHSPAVGAALLAKLQFEQAH